MLIGDMSGGGKLLLRGGLIGIMLLRVVILGVRLGRMMYLGVLFDVLRGLGLMSMWLLRVFRVFGLVL